MGVIVWLKGSLRELLEKIKSTLSLVFLSHPVVRLKPILPGGEQHCTGAWAAAQHIGARPVLEGCQLCEPTP